jgi:sulfur relay (sulfurtransferase) DsrF/TusC family protein
MRDSATSSQQAALSEGSYDLQNLFVPEQSLRERRLTTLQYTATIAPLR